MHDKEENARKEFNRWAELGRGEGMIEGHGDIAEQMIEAMGLKPNFRVLDLGCGVGWATRLIASRVPEGEAVGVDISDEMAGRAANHPDNPSNISFKVAAASQLPFPEGHFDRIFSVESIYYYPDIPSALKEVYRVTAPGGIAFFMVNLYKENEGSKHWVEKLSIPTQLLSEQEYADLFRQAGFSNAHTERYHDRRPEEMLLQPTSFDTLDHIKKALEAGSLVIIAEK